MAVGQPPAVARHRLRLALREAREQSGRTQRQVAQALEWSMAKVNRIEGGEVTITPTDLQALLRLLDVTAEDLVEHLLSLARAARRRGWWWEQPEYRDHLTPANIEAVQFELAAQVIRSFQPIVIPGPLQTREYATALLSSPWSAQLSEADVVARVEARQRRRQHLLTRPDQPDFLVTLDESVLRREVGGPRIVSEQLYDLLRLAQESRVVVRVLPFRHPGGYAAFGLFAIYETEHPGTALVYREIYEADEALVAPDKVRRHQALFERIWEQSLDIEASAHLIEARAAAMRSVADQLVRDT